MNLQFYPWRWKAKKANSDEGENGLSGNADFCLLIDDSGASSWSHELCREVFNLMVQSTQKRNVIGEGKFG
jgi:hypothetical protein